MYPDVETSTFLDSLGKYYFNKKYWKGLLALDSYVTDQMFTKVNCGKISLIL